jgi:hypothetical protein
MEMTGAALRAICKENKLYETPELNETLYCNHRGFISVAELEPYTGLRALFVDNNALDTLDGVPALPELRCLCAPLCRSYQSLAVACLRTRPPGASASLRVIRRRRYAQCNMLMDLVGLSRLGNLDTLNVSNNSVSTLDVRAPAP